MTTAQQAEPRLAELLDRASALADAAGTGTTSSTAYDTAVLAALRGDRGEILFPSTTNWLETHQHPDGAWGGDHPLPHDRLAATLAAVVALADIAAAADQVLAGTRLIHRCATDWATSFPDTIGFELVVPHLLAQARQRNLDLPYRELGQVEAVRDAKLAQIPAGKLLDSHSNLAFSAEFLVGLPAERLRRLKSINGSYASSPSASAAAWAITGDADTWTYLRSVLDRSPDGGASAIYPMDVFDRAWVLGPLADTGLLGSADPRTLAAHRDYLLEALGPQGAPATVGGPAPDSDTTAMSILVAAKLGASIGDHLDMLLGYEDQDRFRCFAFERDPSISANARVARALRLRPERYTDQVAKVDAFLDQARSDGGWWQDKWHISPYYTTAVVAAGGVNRPWSWADTRRWLLDSQRADGSWGLTTGTHEETAYAVTALTDITGPYDAEVGSALTRAGRYLSTEAESVPPLWIAKSLYAPLHVVDAVVLSAQALCLHRATALSTSR